MNALICEPGHYAFTKNGSDCQVCPPGTFSEFAGAEHCIPCLDTIYNGEGANSAELWNGDLYCIHLGSIHGDFLTSNSEDTTELSVSTSPISIQVAVKAPSMFPSSPPSKSPSITPSNMIKSIAPTTSSSFHNEIDVTSDEFQSQVLQNDAESATDSYEFHGRFQKCPEKHEMISYPILVIILLIILVVFLELIIPNSFVNHIWWGMEYFQMLYLIGISSDSWSLASKFYFGKILPFFSIDFNASFSLQCIIPENWPQEEALDQLLVLSLPIIFLVLATFISKSFGNRIIRDETVSRWMAVLLYVGYLKLVLSSLEAIQLPTSWSADVLSVWVNSDSFYSTLAGYAGLLFYGVIFPAWFLQGILRYKMLAQALSETEEEQDNENDGQQCRGSKTEKHAKRKNQIFMTIGIFPINLQQTAWWWPGIWMLRKFVLSIVWYLFPDKQIQFLMIFTLVFLLSVIIQKHFHPLGDDKAPTELTKSWHSITAIKTLDTVLNCELTALVGIVFFFLWPNDTDASMRSLFHQRLEDFLILCGFASSSLFLVVTIGVCCTRPGPRFRELVSKIIVSKEKAEKKQKNKKATSADEISAFPSITECPSYDDTEIDIDFFAAGKDSAWSHKDTSERVFDEGYSVKSKPVTMDYASYDPSPNPTPKDKTTSSKSRPKIPRSDSTIATNDDHYFALDLENDAKTVYEEVWVDEETGEEIIDPELGDWMDAKTGLPAVHPNDTDSAEITD